MGGLRGFRLSLPLRSKSAIRPSKMEAHCPVSIRWNSPGSSTRSARAPGGILVALSRAGTSAAAPHRAPNSSVAERSSIGADPGWVATSGGRVVDVWEGWTPPPGSSLTRLRGLRWYLASWTSAALHLYTRPRVPGW